MYVVTKSAAFLGDMPCPASFALQALTNTVLVIAIVGASSVVLFAINSTLAELSKISYR